MAAAEIKMRAVLAVLCLMVVSGCYVRTNLRVRSDRVPENYLSPVLVIAVSDKVGLAENQLTELQQEALQAFRDRGVECTTLQEAIGTSAAKNPGELLKSKGYRALLEIVITSWGSKTEILPDLAGPSVDSMDTSRDSSMFQPGSIEESQYPGPSTSYKEVDMTGSLLDVELDRVLWSAEISSRPLLAGRSFLYHRFNRSLHYEDLARRCLAKLVDRFPRIWSSAADTGPAKPRH
jgi:hypothetical protein